jgi:RNA-directed DNA polymerase
MINVSEEMKHLHKLAIQAPSKRFNKLWHMLISPEWLSQAWEEIRRNQGSQTAGIDHMTAIDVDLNLINKLAEELEANRYRPTPVRRVYIPKANGKVRPLGIPTLKDRIVQQALKMLLEPIFEADFHICSHGFRQGRSTHTALRDVARGYSAGISWIVEGDIKGCYDNIPHGRLIKQVEIRVADAKVLSLIKRFLKAGYMEDWKYHKTYSGTPQGGILSPLLANVFLHQLDEFAVSELAANRVQTQKESNSRRNPEYRSVENKITLLRRKLRDTDEQGRRLIIDELRELERKRRKIPVYAKDKRQSCKVKYVRYADDFVILVAGRKEEADAIKNKVKQLLSERGLTLSDEKTKVTHWSKKVRFLGYDIKGKLRARGIGIRAVLSIPQEKIKKAREALKAVSGYYHIPEVDAMTQMNSIYRGWCNYYRYANAPQQDFNKLAKDMWWQYACFLARKQKSRIAPLIRQQRKAHALGRVKRNGRERNTFQITVGTKTMILNIFPPKTEQIRSISSKQNWGVDLQPVVIMNWLSGRSFATRLAALDRANGICERCGERPVDGVHHTIPLRRKSFLARILSDKDQRQTAAALCKECHLEAHGGSFCPRAKKLSRNAGCIERCSSGVGSAI